MEEEFLVIEMHKLRFFGMNYIKTVKAEDSGEAFKKFRKEKPEIDGELLIVSKKHAISANMPEVLEHYAELKLKKSHE